MRTDNGVGKSRPGRHEDRYRQIAETVARHSLGFLVDRLGLDRFLPRHRSLFAQSSALAPHEPAERLRVVLEELGTTYIKLGQIVSTRADLLPSDYQAELAKLQDAAPPIPTSEIRDVITAELGKPIDELFQSFDDVPLAAASIGQAHAATLPDGTEVVVKVRRPGVVEQVEADLEILQNLAAVATRRWEAAEDYDLVGLAQEFAQTLRAELDYLREGHNAERFAEIFAGDPNVHVPRVYWDRTTSRVLTLERMRGIKINDVAALQAVGLITSRLAARASGTLLEMIFEEGFFHADPHPGNFFVEADGRIGLIDFGMVGVLDDRTQEQLAEMLLAVTARDGERLADILLALGFARQRVDRAVLQQDLESLLNRYYGRSLGELPLVPMLRDTLEVMRRHHLRLPINLALLVKTLTMAEGLATQLDPSFNLTGVLGPYAQRLLLRQYSPLRWARRLGSAGIDAAQLGVELPQQLRRMMGDLERGGLEVGMRPVGYERLLRRVEAIVNRIVLGIIAAAFVNGLAVLMSIYRPPGFEHWAGGLFAIGFLAAVLLGAYIAWGIVFPRRE